MLKGRVDLRIRRFDTGGSMRMSLLGLSTSGLKDRGAMSDEMLDIEVL